MLTKRQKELLDFLRAYIAEHGYAPTLDEIGRHFALGSLATVHKHLTNLERKGRDRKSTRLELQSLTNLVCRLLLEKKKKNTKTPKTIKTKQQTPKQSTNTG